MNEHLIIRLNSQPSDPIQWIVWATELKEVIASGELSSSEKMAELTQYTAQRSTSVLLPSCDVLLRDVIIPEGAERQLSSMLPFLIEDDLAQDVDDLHITILKKNKDIAHVAIVEHSKMEMWLELLKDADIDVKRFLPDVLALPCHSDGLSMIQINDQWLLRFHEYQGSVAEEQWLSELITGVVTEKIAFKNDSNKSDIHQNNNDAIEGPLAVEQQEEALKITDDYVLHSYSPLSLVIENAEVKEESPELAMQLLAEGTMSSKLNLLTLQYRSLPSWRKYWRIWNKVGVALFLCVLSFVASSIIQVQILEKQSNALRAESERIFRVVFPNKQKIPTVSYLKSQMSTEESRLQGGDGGDDVLTWMVDIQPYLNEVPQVTVRNLKFDGERNELRLQASASDFPFFEQLTSTLDNEFVTEQGQLSKDEEQVFGTIVIRRK